MIITPWLLCRITCWRKKMPDDVLMEEGADFTDPVDMGNHADHWRVRVRSTEV